MIGSEVCIVVILIAGAAVVLGRALLPSLAMAVVAGLLAPTISSFFGDEG